VTKTPASTLAKTQVKSAAPAAGSDAEAAAPKSRAKPATKVSSSADGDAPASTPLKKPSAKADTEPMNAAKSPTDTKLASAWKTKAGKDLTEPELMAMPESEYMGEKQLEFFRAKLQALKDDLLSNAGETTEHLREDTSIVPDPADRATIEEEHALELRTRDRERKLLKKISQSIGRIDAGDYGYCDETGEPIGLGRLLARPTATLSLEAQQRREMKQKMFGD
jgi:DnaK suppressor protein